jgi:tetratricopeptide (TPR) repeat protein
VKPCFLPILILLTTIGLHAAQAGTASRSSNSSTNWFAIGFTQAQAGRFPEAATAFSIAAQARPAAGTLVNLGLSEWQCGHAGAAILAWEQARWIDPFDARAKANLQFARRIAQVDEPELKWFETASTWLAPNAWVWLAGASLWLAVGALILPKIFRRNKPSNLQLLAAFGFALFLFSVTASVGTMSRTNLGFVVKRNAPLQLTPTRDGEMLLTLTSGESGRVLKTRGGYYLIQTANATGWVEHSNFGLICPP